MLTRGQLNTYLETYDRSMSLRRLLNLTPWITKLRDFVQGLNDDAPIDALKLVELQDIVNTRAPDTVTFRGELPADVALAKNINDALHGKTLTSFNADGSAEEAFAEHVFMMVFEGLRPEQRAQLMTLNKRYNTVLSDSSFWKMAVQKHFKWAFNQKKSLLGVNWLQVFRASHRDEYQPLNQRGKKLFSSIKSGDLTELILLNLKSSDLHLVNRQSNPLWNYLSSEQPQALLDYIYRLINQDRKDMNGLTLNHWASICNQVESVLLNVNLADSWGRTPLYVAACSGHLATVEELIAADANLNAARNDGVTPLYVAAYNGHLAVVEALIEAGVDVNAARNDGETPLYVAAQNGHLAVVEALIEAGANANAARNDGATPLYFAVKNGHLAVVEALIAAGANSNAASHSGATPLYIAVRKGHLTIVEALIAAGANVNAACADGETLLDVAKRKKHHDIVKLLSQKKLDLYIKEKSESNELSQHTMTLFGKTIPYGYSKEQELSAAIALKVVTQGADESILKGHRGALNQGDLKSLYKNLMRKR